MDQQGGVVKKVTDAFKQAWSDGLGPRIEEHLPSDARLRDVALWELVATDLELRLKRGDAARVEGYLERFPELRAEPQRLADLIYSEYLLRQRGEPRLRLADYGQRFPEVYEEILAKEQAETLEGGVPHRLVKLTCPHCGSPIALPGDGEGNSVGQRCPECDKAIEIDNSATLTYKPKELPTLGRFTLIDLVGQGSFGTVYRARDTVLDRTVAVKIPRASIVATNDDADRFIREGRSMAQLDHPGIVAVYDVARTDELLPYIVTEFIEGGTLADAIATQTFTAHQTAEIAAQIAAALDHAHQHGVVHRDLKPSNIMLQPRDGGTINPSGSTISDRSAESLRGSIIRHGKSSVASDLPYRIRVMDFGMARRESGDATVTHEGQILGTPAYISPEQAAGQAHVVDGRSDVYSLGVILYELLAGERPFRGNLRMLIHQVLNEEPRNPRSLNDRVPRDLETICIKCMQKELNKRYQGAHEVEDDLNRFLTGQPILARPVGRTERLWRWCRRNPVVASLATTAAALLVAVAIVGNVGYVNTKSALRQADENFHMALNAVDEMLTVVGSESLANVPQMEQARSQLLQKALEFYQGLLKQSPQDIGARHEVARAYHRVADIHRMLGERDKAEAAYEHAVERLKELAVEFPQEPEYRHHLGITYDYFGELLRATKKAEKAKYAYDSALEIQERLVQQFGNPEYRQELSRTRNNFGILLMDSDQNKEAEESFRKALQGLDELVQDYSEQIDYQQELARSNINLGILLKKTNRVGEAEEAYRRAVALLESVVERYPDVHDYQYKRAVSLVDLSNLLNKSSARPGRGEHDPQPPVETAIELLSKLVDDYPRIPLYKKELANAYNSLAAVQATKGDYAAAGENWIKARDLFEQLVKEYDDNPEYKSLLGVILGGQAFLADKQNEQQQARRLVQEAIDCQKSALKSSPQNPDYRQRLVEHEIFLRKLEAQENGEKTVELSNP